MPWEFWKSKTFWTSAITAVAALGFYFTGRMDLVDLAQIESVCAMVAFLRNGVAKLQ